ncbi:hypothetical protein J6590_061456 [Homalodisca vitripennis]|nr:hypothetical protein J6590_061456 [Homalodisca vitripennis]
MGFRTLAVGMYPKLKLKYNTRSGITRHTSTDRCGILCRYYTSHQHRHMWDTLPLLHVTPAQTDVGYSAAINVTPAQTYVGYSAAITRHTSSDISEILCRYYTSHQHRHMWDTLPLLHVTPAQTYPLLHVTPAQTYVGYSAAITRHTSTDICGILFRYYTSHQHRHMWDTLPLLHVTPAQTNVGYSAWVSSTNRLLYYKQPPSYNDHHHHTISPHAEGSHHPSILVTMIKYCCFNRWQGIWYSLLCSGTGNSVPGPKAFEHVYDDGVTPSGTHDLLQLPPCTSSGTHDLLQLPPCTRPVTYRAFVKRDMRPMGTHDLLQLPPCTRPVTYRAFVKRDMRPMGYT